jgi:hypothetical protein
MENLIFCINGYVIERSDFEKEGREKQDRSKRERTALE